MCGIAGVLGGWSEAGAGQIASMMIAALAHRGPDGRRVRVVAAGQDTHLALAHARLSVLDLSPAAGQPMSHEETGSCLIYNGELYNHRALRRDLERKGHRFRSTGDTEVLLSALVEWGADAVPRLNGMYAFAYWDGPGRRLMMARDPLGIKPLVLAHTGRGLVFASELRGLRASGVVDVGVSPGAVRSFLTYGAVIEPETALTAAVALPPGGVVIATPDGSVSVPVSVLGLDELLQIRRGPVAARRREPKSHPAVSSALAGAVESHVTADVRVGVLLSGGIDSTLLAILADRIPDRPVELLTIGFEGAPSPELAQASAVAQRLRSPHAVVTLSGRELSDLLPAALAAMDQPTVDGINVFVASSIAAGRGIRVLLSGLGGDELFGGYTTFRSVPLMARFARYGAPIAPILGALDRTRQQQWRKLARAARISECRDAYLLQRAIHSGPAHPALPSLEGPPADCQMPPEAWEQLAAAANWDPFHQVSYLELSFYMRNQLLRDADVFSSAVAVEMRVPYLDLDVVRAAWHAPAGDHGRGGSKAMLRALLAEAMPDLSFRGPKIGFTLPWNDWLRGPLRPMVADVLHTPVAYQALGLDHRRGCRMFDDFLNARSTVSWFQVWSLFVLLTWHAEQQQSLAA